MNKKRLYWSVMGNEPQERSARKEDFENFERTLNIMFGKYGTFDVLSTMRRTYDNYIKNEEEVLENE